MNDNDKPIVGNKYSYKDTSNVIKVIIVKTISESGSRITVKDERGDEFDILKKEWKDRCEPLSSEGSKSEKHTRDSDSTFQENDIGGSKTGEVEDNPGPKKRIYLLLLALCVFLGLVVFVLSVSLVQSKKKNDRIKNEYTNIIRDNKAQIESLTLSINNLQDDTTRKQKTIDSLLKLEPYRRIKELENKLKSANNENYDLNKQNHIKEDSIKELKKRIRELENQHPRIIEIEKEVRQKNDSIKALKSQIETLNNQIASKESSIRELNGQIASKDKRIKEQGKQVKQKENENKNLKKNCDDFEFQLSKANDSINSLKSELANKENKIKDMNETITNKNKEIESLTNTIKGKK